jgi:hypothetical protein
MTTVTADRESVLLRQTSRRKLWFLSAGTVVFLALCAAAAFLGTHWPFTQAKVMRALQQNWPGEVNVGQIHRTYFPRPGCVLENVTLNRRSSSAGDIPPLVSIRAATIEANYHDLLLRPGYLSRIVLEGLHIYVPVKPSDSATNAGQPQTSKTEQQTGKSGSSSTRLGEVFTKDAVLEVARQEGSPLRFDIRQLDLQTIQKNSPMSYELAMRNAMPPGEIQSRGKIGPWDSSHLETMPVSGDYTFENADLGVFQGIAGIASARGEFKGVLGKIETTGTTDTPKFEVTRSKHPVPIKTKFDALVDGINGNTILRSVEATILHTAAHIEGTVSSKPGQTGKTAVVNITVGNGHIDDVLRMFVREPKPPMEGATNFKAHVVLPPDHRPFTKRVVLQGEFEISHAQWTKESRQASVNTLSKRASGNKKQPDTPSVTAEINGKVLLSEGVAKFSDSTFKVPGAEATFHGTYNLEDRKIDFHGELKTQAEISEDATGAKAVLLKPLDPLFKRKHAGAVVPVEMTGTYSSPHFGVSLTPKKPGAK